MSDPYRSDLEEAFSLLVLVVMSGPTSLILSNYSLPMLHRLTRALSHVLSMSGAQLQKVFLPPGTGFLRRNFPNIDDEFS